MVECGASMIAISESLRHIWPGKEWEIKIFKSNMLLTPTQSMVLLESLGQRVGGDGIGAFKVRIKQYFMFMSLGEGFMSLGLVISLRLCIIISHFPPIYE